MGVGENILKLISSQPNATVVEIGVAQAESAVKLLGLENVKKYIGVDPWLRYETSPSGDLNEGYLDRKMGLWGTQEDWEGAYKRAKQRLEPFGNRVKIIRAFSHEAVERVEDGIDVVFIDGNHQYEYVLCDLNLWYPKLNEGGLLIGDDFSFNGGKVVNGKWGGPQSAQVKAAVVEFCKQKDLNFYVLDGSFVIHKPYNHLLKYRNIHKGERVFLIGNGPSLKRTNLDLIKEEYAIAMNRVSLIYPFTAWRPTYYLYTADNINNKIWGEKWQRSVNEAVSHPETISFVWRIFADKIASNPNIVWLDSVTELDIAEEGTFSTNAAQWISKTGTSMNVAFQLAYFLGFEKVFLLGCDLNWKTTTGTHEDPNHFDSSYSARIPDGERERLRMRRTHNYAHRFFQEAGKEVYNATRATLLDVYPLVDFKNVAKDKQWRGHGGDERSLKIVLKRARIELYWKLGRTARLFVQRTIQRVRSLLRAVLRRLLQPTRRMMMIEKRMKNVGRETIRGVALRVLPAWSRKKSPLPNWICIGVPKAGTTSLSHCLKTHPEIWIPETQRTHFFDSPDYYKGMNWYLKKYYSGADRGGAVGELSPTFFIHKDVPRRIKTRLGKKIRLLVILRNPVDRAWSFYCHNYEVFRTVPFRPTEDLTFEEALLSEPERMRDRNEYKSTHCHGMWLAYFYTGLYAKHLKYWFTVFDRDQFLIIIFEDLINNSNRVLDMITDHLQVSRFSSYPEFKKMSSYSRPGLKESTRRMLQEKYEPHIRELEELLGRRLSSWYE